MGDNRKSNRVTMQDVANHVGVHQTTVSIALRNHPSIPESTRLRIQEAARELGYRKDPAIEAFNRHRLMRLGSNNVQKIAFLTDCDNETDFFRDVSKAAYFEGAKLRAEELNYRLDLVMISSLGDNLKDGLKKAAYSGVIVGAIAATSALELDWSNCSAVAIDSFQFEADLDTFTPNYRQASREAVKQLKFEKYSRIGYYGPSTGCDRIDSLSQVGYLLESRISELPVLQRTCSEDDEAILHWIESDDLDSVICVSEAAGKAVDRVCRIYGKQLRIVVLDCESSTCEFAGVDLNRNRVGYESVSAVSAMLSSGWQSSDLMTTTSLAPVEWRSSNVEVNEPELKRA